MKIYKLSPEKILIDIDTNELLFDSRGYHISNNEEPNDYFIVKPICKYENETNETTEHPVIYLIHDTINITQIVKDNPNILTDKNLRKILLT